MEQDRSYVRASLYKTFGINEATLVDLESRKVISLISHTRHGLVRFQVSGEAETVLQCAIFSPHNAKNLLGEALPFQRFLTLRLFQMSSDLIVEELESRGIWRTTADVIEKYRKKYITHSPKAIQKLLKTQEEASTEQEKVLFNAVLDVLGMQQVYKDPEVIESLSFLGDARLKNTVDCVLVTKNTTFADASDFLKNHLDIICDPMTLAFYATLFMDLSGMDDSDVTKWSKGIKPSYRNSLLAAIGQPLDTFLAYSGLMQSVTEESVFGIAMDTASSVILNTAANYGDESSPAFVNAVKAYMLLVDRRAKLNAASTTSIPKLLTSMVLKKEADDEELLRFPSSEPARGVIGDE